MESFSSTFARCGLARPQGGRGRACSNSADNRRAATLSKTWEDAVHSLRGLPHVIDIRNYGLIGAVELEPRQGKPGARGFDVFLKCFERGVMVRQTGDTIAMSPPLVIEPKQIERIVETLSAVIREVE